MSDRSRDVAIVGIGCRLPGAESADAYWRLLRDGVDATGPIPEDRSTYLHTGLLGRIIRRGGFVEGIDQFDPYFFGLSPRDAIGLDPQTRLLFEAAWRAAEDAGITAPQLKAVRTGVFVGLCSDDYSRLLLWHAPDLEFHTAFGASRSSGAGRLSYAFGLTGPSATFDTACSSSLVAVHFAVRSLQDGDCEMALAGGANALLSPDTTVGFMRGQLLSPRGRCEAFRDDAGGFVRSEGAGMVLLKPLARAMADNDRIYGVIRGSCVNNDGGASLYMAPSVSGQVRALEAAYREAGVDPVDVQYVEAHGTGTRIGDPIEVEALSQVLCADRSPDEPLRVGSCKANIGHLEAGAGIAGLIKAALVVHHRAFPPSIHCDPLNSQIPWDERRVRVQQQLELWPDEIRIAAVNSFGITGTNAHLVLSQAPAVPAPLADPRALRLLPLSARNEDALKTLAREWVPLLRSEAERLSDLCYTASLRRTVYPHRLIAAGRSSAEIADHLDAWLSGETDQDPATRVVQGHVAGYRTALVGPVFVFSGIGSQWPRMALDLYERDEVVRSTFDRVDALFARLSGDSLIDELRRDEAQSRIDQVRVMQPALFALQVALTAWWTSRGVRPAAVIGHSLGEVAAAHAAGAISLEDAVLYVFARSEALARTEHIGGMLVLGVSAQRARDVIRGREDRVAIGVVNSAESVVLSGDRTVLASIANEFQNTDVFCRFVNASVATHSPLMDQVLASIGEQIAAIKPCPERIPLYSTVTGGRLNGGALTPAYWLRNIRETVCFGAAIETALADGAGVFLEISAHPLVVQHIETIARETSAEAVAIATLRRKADSEDAMVTAFGRLAMTGCEIDWRAQAAPEARLVQVPGHPFNRSRFWYEDSCQQVQAERVYSVITRSQAHALLPVRFERADAPGTTTWQVTLQADEHPFIIQHVVAGMAVIPLALYVELALAAALEIFGPGPKTLRHLRMQKIRSMAIDEAVVVQIVARSTGSDTCAVTFYLAEPQDTPANQVWEPACDVTVSAGPTTMPSAPIAFPASEDEIGRRCPHPVSREWILDTQRAAGFSYGPVFQGIESASAGEALHGRREFAAMVELLPEVAEERGFHLHPAFMDAFLQTAFAAADDTILRLPVSIDEIVVDELPVGRTFRCYGIDQKRGREERCDYWLFREDGRPIIAVRGGLGREIAFDTGVERGVNISNWMYQKNWTPAERIAAETTALQHGFWLIVGDADRSADEWIATVKTSLEDRGNVCRLVPAPSETLSSLDFEACLAEAAAATQPWRGIVYQLLNPPEEAPGEPGRAYQRETCDGLLQLLQCCARLDVAEIPRLFVVARGAARVLESDRPVTAFAPACGLARVASHEFPQLRVTTVDVGPGDEPFTASSADLLAVELSAAWSGEAEVAFRAGARYVSRLARLDMTDLPRRSRPLAVGGASPDAYRVMSEQPGSLDRIALELTSRREPGPGEVEIRVTAAGLNFLDVLRGLAMGPAQEPGAVGFGMECSGEIVRIGEGVSGLRPGQRVLCMSIGEGCLRSHLTVAEAVVFPLPDDADLTAAATCLVAYQTAWYALHELGRLRKGERVLIHAAAGGVGLAAVHVAQHLGAEVYGTAGSAEKRAFLQQLGVRHVMNSRTLDFADELMTVTRGEGVDLVLNSISGEAIPRSVEVLRMGGRFLEIGKRDVYANAKLDLFPFRKNLSYHAVDLLGLSLECPALVSRVTREVLDLVFGGALPMLPYTAFPASQAQDAFRYMAQSRQIGKVLITFDEPQLEVEVPMDRLVRADASYLVTGGLTGLGLLTTQWLVEKGARQLILLGRRAPDAHAQRTIETLRNSGVRVEVASIDVSMLDQVEALSSRIRNAGLPPVAGIIHAAGVLHDAVIPNLEWEHFDTVFAPKVHGTQNLGAVFSDLDFLVLFSSIVSTLGSPGQATYAAANAYLDAWSEAAGSPSVLCVNWGPWTGLGMLQDGGLKPAPMFGEHGIRAHEGIASLERLLLRRCSHAAVMPVDWKIWREVVPEIGAQPFFSALRSEMGDATAEETGDAVRRIAAMSPADGRKALLDHVREMVMRVLRIPEARMDDDTGLQQLGIDSLMAVELNHRVRIHLGVTLPLMKLLRGPTVAELSNILYDEVVAASRASIDLPDIDHLPEHEVDALLSQLSAQAD